MCDGYVLEGARLQDLKALNNEIADCGRNRGPEILAAWNID